MTNMSSCYLWSIVVEINLAAHQRTVASCKEVTIIGTACLKTLAILIAHLGSVHVRCGRQSRARGGCGTGGVAHQACSYKYIAWFNTMFILACVYV